MIRRREFITLLGAAAWPLAARDQQGGRMRRIGVLMSGDENDPLRKTYVSAFAQALADLGWNEGRNVRMDFRWTGDDVNRSQALAQELVGLQPDILATAGVPATAAVAGNPDRLWDRGRSRRQWPRRGAQPPGGEHHWLHRIGALICRQVA
jgi:putative ABC transport system substrate-binding protein